MEKVGPREPEIKSLSYGEWHCDNCMEYVSGLEKYECVIWKVCMSLFRIDYGSVR